MIGLPGDFTPPSRFVRAAFFNATAPMWKTSWEAVQQAFHILNNFDIPIGIQFPKGQAPAGMMSATQFTAATDQKAMRFYYRTAYNSSIRCIDLKSVDFAKVKYQSHPLDDVKEEPVQMLKIG
jgi:choloylglycine hydrolase